MYPGSSGGKSSRMLSNIDAGMTRSTPAARADMIASPIPWNQKSFIPSVPEIVPSCGVSSAMSSMGCRFTVPRLPHSVAADASWPSDRGPRQIVYLQSKVNRLAMALRASGEIAGCRAAMKESTASPMPCNESEA